MTVDIEREGKQDDHLTNHAIQNFAWKNIHVNVATSRNISKEVLTEIDGLVSAGKRHSHDIGSTNG